MRVAMFSPMPPERSGIADYSYELLEELRHHVEVSVVVRDDLVGVDSAPEGVEVVGFSSVERENFDCSLYQMGNNPKYHRFFFQRALEEPGLLVLHDPSLADFHAEMCRKADSGVFRAEIAFDTPSIALDDDLPLVEVAPGQIDLDRLEVLLSRRIVEANVRTLVHSSAIAAEMRRRYPGADVSTIQLPAQVVETEPRRANRRPGEVVFGVFGGINYYKRIDSVIEAFNTLHLEYPLATLVIAGRPDDREMTARLVELAASGRFDGRLIVKTELTLAELEAEMTACDVAISLRWPTAGEMSATLMRTFGAARPAVVTDVLQFRELDDRFCWRVPVEPELEAPRLLEVMRFAAGDPSLCVEAGMLAQEFVRSEATYRIVSEQYVEHLAYCAQRLGAKRQAHRPLTLSANTVLGANVLSTFAPASDGDDVVGRLRVALAGEGVDLVDFEVPKKTVRSRPREQRERLIDPAGRPGDAPGLRTAARRGLDLSDRSRAGGRRVERALARQGRARSKRREVGQLHEVDLCFTDEAGAKAMGAFARERHLRGRRIVAVLAPSIMPLPDSFGELLHHADEVWVPSTISADIVRSHTTAPVVVLPTWSAPSTRSPRAQQVSEGGPTTALCVVDASETLARTNPWAAVAAYAAATEPRDRGSATRLVVAVRNLSPDSEGARRLAGELEAVGGELVLDPDDAQLASLVERCDVFVSLHRSSAFGRWCAEAMAAGKPVVATGYGGNVDYMGPTNSCLVGFSTVRISEGDYYLDRLEFAGFDWGQVWAAPDLDQAARYLRRLFGDGALRSRIGESARGAIVASAAAAVASRLPEVRHESPRDLSVARAQATTIGGPTGDVAGAVRGADR